ncbi:nucleotide exchange factor GrpE [Paenibacillus nasutitermitis]|uniref:nucleotide exchange factor GrpE n=1 Tax=Paenibacillus nasutitermitis TaxID=1652958 RepID=UPI00166BB7A9|nr:nucleotide exchange factor GrpE [Paenibacillus nasutitermitis]
MNEQHTGEEHKHETTGASEENLDHQQEQANAAEAAGENAGAADEAQVDTRYEELQKQVEEHQQRYLRAQADFDNFRRRTIKEKEELGAYASMKLIGELLPVIDNFDRALDASKSGGDVESFAKGVDMIFRQFQQVLEQEGLKPMNTVGEVFNPEFHQAIMQVESEEHEEGIIVEEVQKGYIIKDKVLRPAMVKVSG